MNEDKKYNPSGIEKKWQDYWREHETYKTKDGDKEKFYILDMFPYPSGEGLHVGHPKGYIATDIYARQKRMQGFEVLHPMGFDAFGLPAEQYAIKNKLNPRVATEKNVANYKRQLEMLGLDYDWSREVNTTDPEFYKWTQWCFKQMYKAGLVSESYEPINWCPKDMTGLANEDVENGLCERCGTPVEKKPLRQWSIRITDYADRLLEDLDKLDWEPHIKELQRNWIGKSEGAEIDFEVKDFDLQEKLTVFTTRADTLYGVTYLAVSAELAQSWMDKGWQSSDEVGASILSIIEEQKNKPNDYKEEVEKKGIDTGIKAINPANGEEIPVWVANYVLSGYGTGVVMAVPAHDERDNEFAKKYSLEVKEVIISNFEETLLSEDNNNYLFERTVELSRFDFQYGDIYNVDLISNISLYIDGLKVTTTSNLVGSKIIFDISNRPIVFSKGYRVVEVRCDIKSENIVNKNIKTSDSSFYIKVFRLVNSNEFDGTEYEEAKLKIVEKAQGRMKSQYKLRDWVFARQRYWGEPFPIVFDEDKKPYVVVDSELPIVLPDVEHYEPTGTGESPLANIGSWVNVHGFINNDNEFEYLDISKFDFDTTEFVDINLGEGTDRYQSGAPIVERSNVAVIIKHPTDNKYLVSKWKASEWNGWLTGGIEEGDSIEETVRKEVLEETGFTNIKNIDVMNFSVHGLFYHPVKKQNRLAHYKLAVVELASLDNVPVSESEQAICDFVWVEEDEVSDVLTRDEMKSLWAEYKQTGQVFETKLKKFKRETNTMPQWAGSSWYYLRYIDPNNTDNFVDKDLEKNWSPVDFYVGGAEHATRHLIYARFWHKFLYDQGLVSQDEPFKKLQTVGLIMAEDGRKMSKRWGNVVNPDDVVREYGADTLRVYEMFMGPFEQSVAWSTKNMSGSKRFLDRVWKLQERIINETQADEVLINNTIKKVTEDIGQFKFNTAISQMMIILNSFETKGITMDEYSSFLRLLAPFAPHMTEELWHNLGNTTSVHLQAWPQYDPTKLESDSVTISIQVNGKLRGTIECGRDLSEDSVLTLSKEEPNVAKWLTETEIVKHVCVANKLVNFVVKNN